MTTPQPKVIALTGAASGIGRETAIFLASRGHLLSISDLQQGPLDAVVETIAKSGGQVIATVVDVRKRDQVEAWYAATVKHYGRLDGCANIAGVIGKNLGVNSLEDVDDDDFDFVQSVNVKGVLNCLR
jgi:NAD(P)-dependent dehydrogenase (short-subunit alcohol dehydrogenase family)